MATTLCYIPGAFSPLVLRDGEALIQEHIGEGPTSVHRLYWVRADGVKALYMERIGEPILWAESRVEE